MKKTYREQKLQEFYKRINDYDNLVNDLNDQAKHLGNETTFTHLRLYKEQLEQLEDIEQYFAQVQMPKENRTTEAILTIALKEFHHMIMKIKTS